MFVVYECPICRRFTGAFQKDGLCEVCARKRKAADDLAIKGARLTGLGCLAVVIMYAAIVFLIYKVVTWL
jgi:hypothetical protein